MTCFGPAEKVPLELVTAIDVSGSMLSAMPDLKSAVRKFLAALSPRDQVSLLAFDDNLFTPVRRSTDTEARLRAVDRLAAWVGTALYDVILKALDLVGRQQGRRAVVVFSDGQDENSFATVDAVVSRVEASDSTLYMIGQGEATRSEELRTLLLLTEGLIQTNESRTYFTDFARAAAAARVNLYTISIYSPVIDSQRHRIKVTTTREGVELRALAVIAGDGRRGSIDVSHEARLTAAGSVQLSDLMLGTEEAGAFRFAGIETARHIAGFLEIDGVAPEAGSLRARLEVAVDLRSPALASAELSIGRTADPTRSLA